MTEIGKDKVRCDRCYKEAPSDNDLPYSIGHPFSNIITQDLFIRDTFEIWEGLKWSIEIVEELYLAAQEGRKVKRSEYALCKKCNDYIDKNNIFILDFCYRCLEEMQQINGMGNAAIPQECVLCRKKVPMDKNELRNLRARLEALETQYPGLRKGARKWEADMQIQQDVRALLTRKNPNVSESVIMNTINAVERGEMKLEDLR
jgi:hypothetical protein